MKDNDLITALQKRDDAALEQLIAAYGEFIHRVILHYLPNDYERTFVADIENRCYFQVWTKIRMFDPSKGNFEAWLGTVVKNQTTDYKRGLRATYNILSVDDSHLDENVNLATEVEEPVDYQQIFAPLTDSQRQIFEMFYVADLTVPEIAKELHIHRLSVYKQLSRGRKKLQQEVERHDL
ncbi:RNA polymerase sigma factor [Lapidilactobacillus mulanensis]|uniref:RNA polymerase sigma factor n=1 Tax=Lapidilactobacillus mulanensis TaxID=2485999 RepID=A0ABW4DQ25_9LACO|nr:sigma-70 family RNA polymerase sigma factor [Lapidilactobacillus mulanensis]